MARVPYPKPQITLDMTGAACPGPMRGARRALDEILAGEVMLPTGEVLGMADSFGLSYFKAQEATGLRLLSQGSVLITVFDKDQKAVPEIAREFKKLGFKIKATEGTRKFLAERGIETEHVLKMHEGRPNIVDAD